MRHWQTLLQTGSRLGGKLRFSFNPTLGRNDALVRVFADLDWKTWSSIRAGSRPLVENIRAALKSLWRWLTEPYTPPSCRAPGCTPTDPCDDCRWQQVGGL